MRLTRPRRLPRGMPELCVSRFLLTNSTSDRRTRCRSRRRGRAHAPLHIPCSMPTSRFRPRSGPIGPDAGARRQRGARRRPVQEGEERVVAEDRAGRLDAFAGIERQPGVAPELPSVRRPQRGRDARAAANSAEANPSLRAWPIPAVRLTRLPSVPRPSTHSACCSGSSWARRGCRRRGIACSRSASPPPDTLRFRCSSIRGLRVEALARRSALRVVGPEVERALPRDGIAIGAGDGGRRRRSRCPPMFWPLSVGFTKCAALVTESRTEPPPASFVICVWLTMPVQFQPVDVWNESSGVP